MRFGLRIPRRVLLDAELSPRAKCVYGILAGLARPDAARSSMAEWLMCEQYAISKARRELVERGLIAATPPKRRKGKRFIERYRYELLAGHDLHGLVRPAERERITAAWAASASDNARVSHALLLAAYLDLAGRANLGTTDAAAAVSLSLSRAAVGRIHRATKEARNVRSHTRLKEDQVLQGEDLMLKNLVVSPSSTTSPLVVPDTGATVCDVESSARPPLADVLEEGRGEVSAASETAGTKVAA